MEIKPLAHDRAKHEYLCARGGEWAKGRLLGLCVCLSESYRCGGEIPAFLTLVAGSHPYWDRTTAGLFLPGTRGRWGGEGPSAKTWVVAAEFPAPEAVPGSIKQRFCLIFKTSLKMSRGK